jgi:Beta-galactosidase/beta-glucuronidase
MPSDLSDFTLYGGLYRHVNLVYVPTVSIETVHIKTNLVTPGSHAKVEVVTSLYNPTNDTGPIVLDIEVLDAKGASIHTAKRSLPSWTGSWPLASFTLRAPQLWSPASPHLYECRIRVTTSAGKYLARETFGIRHTEWVEHGPFKLNGERLLLKGTHRHEDHAGYAAAMPDDQLEQEMRLIKNMGANFIRLAHYQQSRRVVELCDSLGILVWEEIPWCRGGIGSETFQEMGRRTLRNMITQHYNHPSVLLWGLGNENDWPTEYPEINQEKIRAYLTELRDLSHQLNPTRMTTIRRCDFCRDIPDVYSPPSGPVGTAGRTPSIRSRLRLSANASSISSMPSGEPTATRVAIPKTRIRRSPRSPPAMAPMNAAWPISRPAARLASPAMATGPRPTPAISSTGTSKSRRPSTGLPAPLNGSSRTSRHPFAWRIRSPRVNQKGLITRDMQKKESYFVFESYWSNVPMAHIYGHTWPIRWGTPGEPKMVKVYSNCETAELFLNGKSLGSRTRNSQNFPAGLRWMTPFVEGTNKVRVVAQKGSTTCYRRDRIRLPN